MNIFILKDVEYMLKKDKCVEYFFDSKKYDEKQILESIKKEEKGFEKRKSEISIQLNEYGIYEVKLRFLDNELDFLKLKIKQKNKEKTTRKTYKGYETYNSDNKIYGQYKVTRTYQPI